LETICHFEKIIKLYPELNLESKILKEKYEKLGAMLFNFKKFVHKNWKTDNR
jgi:hypothetical protein